MSAVATGASMSVNDAAAYATGRADRERTARRTSSSEPLSPTTANETSATPPQLANAIPQGTSCSAAPTSPQGIPPSGQRPLSVSGSTHAAAVIHGERRPRRPSQPTSSPVSAVYAEQAATSRRIGSAPKYHSQYI